MLPQWEHASGWSRHAGYLTPEETQELSRQMQLLIREYESRKDHPAGRPAGAVPVEWTIFKAPIAELAGRQPREVSGPAAGADPGGQKRRGRRRPATPER